MNTYGRYDAAQRNREPASGVLYSRRSSGGSGNSIRTETNNVVANARYQDPVAKALADNRPIAGGRLQTATPKVNTNGSYNASAKWSRRPYSSSGSGGSGNSTRTETSRVIGNSTRTETSRVIGNSTRTETSRVIPNASYQDPVTKALVDNIAGGRLQTTKRKMNTYGSYDSSKRKREQASRMLYSGSGNSTYTQINRVMPNVDVMSNADPVTKALLENIKAGALRTNFNCVTCKLEFQSQVHLDHHQKGSKHAKRLKAKEILQTLQETGKTDPEYVVTGNVLACEVCDIVLNSSVQLQTHLAGVKHKTKLLKLSTDSNSADEPLKNVVIIKNAWQGTTVDDEREEKPNSESPDKKAGEAVVRVIVKGPGEKGNKKKYFCETCETTLNSESQLKQHLTSNRHKDRLMGITTPEWHWLKEVKRKLAEADDAAATEDAGEAPPSPSPPPSQEKGLPDYCGEIVEELPSPSSPQSRKKGLPDYCGELVEELPPPSPPQSRKKGLPDYCGEIVEELPPPSPPQRRKKGLPFYCGETVA